MIPCYANHPVSGEIEWPRKETRFLWGRYEIIAFPPDAKHDASLHIDLANAKLSYPEGMSLLNEVLSVAAWLDDASAILLPGWSGNTKPVRPERRTFNYPTSIIDGWCNAWGPLENADARRALAIYREALNMHDLQSASYAALGFYKILEITMTKDEKTQYLINEALAHFPEQELTAYDLEEIGLDQKIDPVTISKFLWEQGRNAAAHANKEPFVNPDDVRDLRKMSIAASYLKSISRTYIQQVLKVGTNRWDEREI